MALDDAVTGLHHVTVIAGDAQENLDFYAGVLGMRLVKKTLNQDRFESRNGWPRRRPGRRSGGRAGDPGSRLHSQI